VKLWYGSCTPCGVLGSNFRCAVATRWPAGPLLASALALAWAVLAPTTAAACGGVPQPSYSISAVFPSPGSSGVARDSGIVVTGVPSSPSGGPSRFADIALIDPESAEAVPLTDVAWFAFEGFEQKLAVHPVEPLAPLHTYRVEVTPVDGENGATAEPFVSSFVTSDALLDPVALSGELGLSLRGADMDVEESGPCGQDVTVIGKQRVLMADVDLPVPSGGQGVYHAAVHFTDDTPTRIETSDPLNYELPGAEPHLFHTMNILAMVAGQALTVEQIVFDEGIAYAGCFTLVVWDPGGHGAQTSRCLPSLTPDELRALAEGEYTLDVAMDEAVAVQDVQGAVEDYRESRSPALGCSFGPLAPTSAPAWFTWLLGVLLVVRVSRRRGSVAQF
jgi:hypothetical protein